jgi:hypothetical protein
VTSSVPSRAWRSTRQRGRGRPRHPAIDDLVVEATTALLAEKGYEATTVQEISRRAGVHTSAIYPRWPNRVALIQDVAFPPLPRGQCPARKTQIAQRRRGMARRFRR